MVASQETFARGIAVFTGLILVVILAAAARDTLGNLVLVTGIIAGYVLVFSWGWRFRPKGGLNFLWLSALLLLWLAMLPHVQIAVYLVFPMYFLYLMVLPQRQAIGAVVVATAVAIASQYPHIVPSGVIGPIVAALVSVAIDAAFRALWRVMDERQELIEELLAARSQLAEKERAAGVAAERQRIAHEIHDTLAQGLSSIQMLLHVAEQELEKPEPTIPRAISSITAARGVAKDNLAEARAMIAALQPAALQQTSLEGALERLAESTEGISTQVSVDGQVRQLPMKQEATLLRIAQGALGNVAKHSRASRCRITLTYAPDEVRLDVVDNGQGFDPAQVAAKPSGLGHIGLQAMRQRAEELGGELEVESAPGRGTAVSVALPAQEFASAANPDTAARLGYDGKS